MSCLGAIGPLFLLMGFAPEPRLHNIALRVVWLILLIGRFVAIDAAIVWRDVREDADIEDVIAGVGRLIVSSVITLGYLILHGPARHAVSATLKRAERPALSSSCKVDLTTADRWDPVSRDLRRAGHLRFAAFLVLVVPSVLYFCFEVNRVYGSRILLPQPTAYVGIVVIMIGGFALPFLTAMLLRISRMAVLAGYDGSRAVADLRVLLLIVFGAAIVALVGSVGVLLPFGIVLDINGKFDRVLVPFSTVIVCIAVGSELWWTLDTWAHAVADSSKQQLDAAERWHERPWVKQGRAKESTTRHVARVIRTGLAIAASLLLVCAPFIVIAGPVSVALDVDNFFSHHSRVTPGAPGALFTFFTGAPVFASASVLVPLAPFPLALWPALWGRAYAVVLVLVMATLSLQFVTTDLIMYFAVFTVVMTGQVVFVSHLFKLGPRWQGTVHMALCTLLIGSLAIVIGVFVLPPFLSVTSDRLRVLLRLAVEALVVLLFAVVKAICSVSAFRNRNVSRPHIQLAFAGALILLGRFMVASMGSLASQLATVLILAVLEFASVSVFPLVGLAVARLRAPASTPLAAMMENVKERLSSPVVAYAVVAKMAAEYAGIVLVIAFYLVHTLVWQPWTDEIRAFLVSVLISACFQFVVEVAVDMLVLHFRMEHHDVSFENVFATPHFVLSTCLMTLLPILTITKYILGLVIRTVMQHR